MAFKIRSIIGAVLPDNVNTDLIFPARYLTLFSPEEVAKHLFEDIDSSIAAKISGKAVLGGENMGCGSAREQGLTALKYGKVELVVAKSFSRAFYRNGFNNGYSLFIADCSEPIAEIGKEGDEIEADFETGLLCNLTTGKTFRCSPTPAFLIDLLKEDGIWNYIRRHGTENGEKS